MGGDPKHHHGEKQPDTFDTTKQEPQGELDPKVSPTPVDQAHKIAQAARQPVDASPGIAGPPKVDLGDHALDGRAHYENVMLFNTQALDAYVQVSVEGSPAIVLASAPQRLRPSHEGVDPTAAISLAFAPTARGRVHGTLVVQAGWQNSVHAPQELRIPIEAAAHDEGEPLVADQEAEDRQRAEKEKADADDKAQMEHAKEATEARLDDPKQANKLPGTAADRKRFGEAEKRASDALSDLFDNRRAGIDTAQGEAEKFQRHVPPHEESLLEVLAWTALDVATAGIAGALGKKLETALSKSMTVAAHTLPNGARAAEQTFTPSKAVVAFFTDSVKDVVKRSGKAATSAVKHGATGHDKSAKHEQGSQDDPQLIDPGPSADPLLAFFQTERVSLTHQKREKATEVGQNASNVLEPMLDSTPKQAINAMNNIAASVEDFNTSELAANQQAQASATHWIQYIAQTSLGTVSADDARADHKHAAADGGPTSNISTANQASGQASEPSARDGLLDVRFTADRSRPWEPVVVTSGRVNGISQAMMDRLRREPLRNAHVPVRAYAQPSGGDAVTGIEVIRDEAGNIQYTDETGAPGMPGNWFARMIGEPSGGRDAQSRGARKLIEEQIVSKPAPADIENDSDA